MATTLRVSSARHRSQATANSSSSSSELKEASNPVRARLRCQERAMTMHRGVNTAWLREAEHLLRCFEVGRVVSLQFNRLLLFQDMLLSLYCFSFSPTIVLVCFASEIKLEHRDRHRDLGDRGDRKAESEATTTTILNHSIAPIQHSRGTPHLVLLPSSYPPCSP